MVVAGCKAESVLNLGFLLFFFQSLWFFLTCHCSGGSFPQKILTLHSELKSELSVLTMAVKGL